jgi:hypothetical protein
VTSQILAYFPNQSPEINTLDNHVIVCNRVHGSPSNRFVKGKIFMGVDDEIIRADSTQ